MSQLICNSLTKNYGKTTALKDVSLILEPHRIYGLIGRNGAGKTTLLGILSGQNPASGGTVEYAGENIWENQNAMNEICFSREINAAILFGSDNRMVKTLLTTAEIMLPYWDKEYAAMITDKFQLDTKKRINKLSKGMLSAVTVIIALASKAPFTFLDEPVAGLDVFMRDLFYKLLMEEFTNSSRTFVVSTHIIDEAANVLEDIIILEKGQIIKNENTQDLLARHRIVNGRDTDIDEFSKGYKVLHSESLGRSKSVCVEIKDPHTFEEDVKNFNFDVSQASLQKLFMKLL